MMSESGGGSKNECLKHEHTDQQRHLVHHRNITQKNAVRDSKKEK